MDKKGFYCNRHGDFFDIAYCPDCYKNIQKRWKKTRFYTTFRKGYLVALLVAVVLYLFVN